MSNKTELAFKIQLFTELTTLKLFNIFKTRCDIFVVEQNCAYPEIDELDMNCWHLQGVNGGNLVAYARIIPPNIHPTGKPAIGRVLTVKEFRGKNYGRELMLKAIEFCHQHYPNQPIFISAQIYLLDFYQSLGFVSQGEIYLDDGISHVDMILES